MKISVIQNGVLSLTLTAESEIDLIALKELSKSEVTFQLHEKLQIMDKVLPNTVVIAAKVKAVE